MGFEAHGAFNRWWVHKTYRHNSNRYHTYTPLGHIICKYYYPYNARTIEQQTPRNFFAYAVSNWQTFGEEEKGYYNEIVGKKPLSGYNHYISLYLKSRPAPPVVENFILCENGDNITTEAGENLETE